MLDRSEDGSLEGRWVLITGAARRIGATIAETLHAAGANIALHYRHSAQDAQEIQQRMERRRADSTLLLAADLLDDDAPQLLVESVVAYAGRLDVLLNNASSFYPTPLGTVTQEQWRDLFGTNLKAPLFLAQAALPHLTATGGQILNIIDIHARRPMRDHPVYGPAKAGLAMLTLSLARDLAPRIRVNGIAPGAILWPEQGFDPDIQQQILRQVPLARPGSPDDIARTALFLLRDAPYITGQIIAVDGGRSVGW